MARSGTGERITDRQVEVARLVYLGRTNGEIAGELGISLDGAKYHVSELLGRLGVERREDIGMWYAAEHGSRLRERLGWVLSPLGAVAAGAGVVAVLGVVAVSIALVRADSASPTDGSFSVGALQVVPAGGMHDPARISHDATRLLDGRVLVTGGVDPDLEGGQSTPLRSAEIYDPETDNWTRVEDMPFALLDHAGVTLPDGRVQFIGGISPGPDFATAMETQLWFDPRSETFLTRPSDPALDGPITLRGGPSLAVRRGNSPVIVGQRGQFLHYEADRDVWVDLEPFEQDQQFLGSPSGPMLIDAAVLTDGRIAMIWTDFASDGQSLENVVGIYELGDSTVTELLRLESRPEAPRVEALLGGGMAVLSATGPNGAFEARYLETPEGPPVLVPFHTAASGLDEYLELPSGEFEVLSASFNHATLRLQREPTGAELELLPIARAGQLVTTLDDGRLLVTGGLRLTSDARARAEAGELEFGDGLLFSFAPDDAASLEPFEESPPLLITLP